MRRQGYILITLGLLLIAGALALVIYNRAESERAGEASEAILETLLEAIAENASAKRDPYGGVSWQPGSWDEAWSGSLSEDGDGIGNSADEVKGKDVKIPEMAVTYVDGYAYIGVIEIPAEEISLPVMAEWDLDRLREAPCRYTGSYYTNDLVVCAHNYQRHFAPIRWVDLGADVYFTTVDGTVLHYIVANRETVGPTDIETMIDSEADWDLTLFTCNIGGQTRCAVRCERAEN